MREKVCDICGMKFVRGLKIRALRNGIAPWNKKIFICDKCENVIKLMVLKNLRRDEYKKIFEEEMKNV